MEEMMKIKSFKLPFLFIIASLIITGCGTKAQNNKFVGLWQAKNLILVLEKNGTGNVLFGEYQRDIYSIKWNMINDYIVLEDLSNKLKTIYLKLVNTDDDRFMYMYDSDKFTEIKGILIKNEIK